MTSDRMSINNTLFRIKEYSFKRLENGEIIISVPITENILNEILSKGEMESETKKETDKKTEALTSREKEVLYYISKGRRNHEIAEIMAVSIHTVKVYVANILQKLNVKDRVQAAIIAISENIADL